MPEEIKPAESTAAGSVNQPPEDYNEFVAWRGGQKPAAGEQLETPSAAPEKPEAKTAGEPEPLDTEREDDEGQEQEQDQEQEKPDKDKPRKGGYQKRIDRLTQRNRELQQRIEALEKGQPKAAEPAEKPAANSAAEGKPEPQDFETYESYVEALTDWKAEQREAAQRAKADKQKAKEAADAKLADWNAREAAVKKARPDYDDVVTQVDDIALPAHMMQLIFESPHGPELSYRLAQNRADVERIAKLDPLACARELGKIEAHLEATSSSPAKPANKKSEVTSAPKPIKPVAGGGSGTQPNLHDDALADDYNAWRDVREGQLRR